ncbi:MAG: ATP-binding protein [Ruminococcus sp.]|jgi:DNA replication protein DnaC|nr:ATP-binding protein [Ruminococcus sp.]
MSFNETAYANAQKELSNRKFNAEETAKARFEKVSSAIPEINKIDSMMKAHIINLTNFVFQKNDVSKQLEKIKSEYAHGETLKQKLLKENGYPEDYLKIKYSCEKCNDTGFIDGVRCKCFLRLINSYSIAELNRTANLPDCDFEHFNLEFYRGKTNNNYNIYNIMENNYMVLRKYAEEFNENSESLLIYGKTGLGKTHISIAMAKRIIEKGYTVAYSSIISLLENISRDKFERNNQYSNTERDIIDVDLLIIDDLGSEYETPYLESIIYHVINSRMNLQKPTIINCNLDKLDDLSDRYDYRIVSRITNYYKRVHFGGSDIRQIKRK